MYVKDKYLISDPGDIKALQKVLDGQKLSGTSDFVLEYEKHLATFWGNKNAIAVSSGTTALQSAMFVAGVSAGDEVIVSPTCPSMSIVSILLIGAIPVFCDVDPDSFGLSLESLRQKITSRTRAVIEVPMWGYPVEADKLESFLKQRRIPLIFDLAQAHGTKCGNKYLSSFGDMSCFSTHDRKILSTGEGGFILTDNDDYATSIKSYIQFGNMDGIHFGVNCKLGALQSAVGSNRIKLVDKQLEGRRENAKKLLGLIHNEKVTELSATNAGKPNYYALVLKLNFHDNQKFIEYLESEGVPSDIIRYNYKVLYKYPLFERFAQNCPNAEALVKSITTIPVHPGLSEAELNYIAEKINNYKED